MDNLSGLFGDGDLSDLDLGGDSFGGPPGPTPVSVSELDLNSYSQPSYTSIGSGAGGPPPQGPGQKMSMGGGPPPSTQSMYPGPGAGAGYQYAGAPGQQPPMSQYQGSQYPSSYPPSGQEMYAQRPVQPNQGVPTWNNQPDPYNQHYQQQPNYSQTGLTPYQNQGMTNSSIGGSMQQNIPQNYQGMAPQSMGQGYPPGSQGIVFQSAPRPPYPGFDPQRPMASNSPNMSPYGGAPPAPGQPQQYAMRQPYQTGQYPQGQVPIGGQQQQQHPGQPMMGGPRPQGDINQYPGTQVPNGTPGYRTSFSQASPQMSPHPQPSPRPQMSPMPRSMSPHPRPNSNLGMTTPVSSPASMPPTSSVSPVPALGGGPGSSLQQLENMVKPSVVAGRNTPTSQRCTTPTQPMQSPGHYAGSSGVPSPMGGRAPMSPGMGSRPSMGTPMSPGLGSTRPPMSPGIGPVTTRPPMSPGIGPGSVRPPMSPGLGPGGARPPVSPQQWQQARPMTQQSYVQPGSYLQQTNLAAGQRPAHPISQQQSPISAQQGQDSVLPDSICNVSDGNLTPSTSTSSVCFSQSNGPVSTQSVNSNIVNSAVISLVNSESISESVQVQASSGPTTTLTTTVNGPTQTITATQRQQPSAPTNVPTASSSPGSVPTSAMSQNGMMPNTVTSNGLPPNTRTPNSMSPGSLSSASVPMGISPCGPQGSGMMRFPSPHGPRSPYLQQTISQPGYRIIGPGTYGPQGQVSQDQMTLGSGQLQPGQVASGGPTQMQPVGPTQMQPVGPTQMLPGGPTHMQPGGPTQMQPGGPTQMQPGGPTQMQSGGPTQMQHVGPTQMQPGGPTQMQPGGPTQMLPGGPTQMQPGGPTQMLPGGPTQMQPGGPTQMLPGGPTQMQPGVPTQMQPGGPTQMQHGPTQIHPGGPNQMQLSGPGQMHPGGPTQMQHGGLNQMQLSGPGQMQHGGPGQMQHGGPNQMQHGGPSQMHQAGQLTSMAPGQMPSRPAGPPGPTNQMPVGRGGPMSTCSPGQVPTTGAAGQMGPGQMGSVGQMGSGMHTQNPMGPGMTTGGPMGMPQGAVGGPGMTPQGPHSMQPQMNFSYEIQQCQQQLQQLYKMPQSVQTQQKIQELQQRINHLQQQQTQPQQYLQQTQTSIINQQQQDDGGGANKSTKSKKRPSKPKVPKPPRPPKEPKPKKEVKAKKDTKAKEPKELKAKRVSVPPRKSRAKKAVQSTAPDGSALPVDTGTGAPPAALMDPAVAPPGTPLDPTKVNPATGLPINASVAPGIPVTVANAKPKIEKKPKVKSSTPVKRKPSAKLTLNFKRKRKRRGSESDFSEGEQGGGNTIPREDDEANKRRSGRNTSRKKYVDELDLNLSDDDNLLIKNSSGNPGLGGSGGGDPQSAADLAAAYTGQSQPEEGESNLVKPNFVYVDPNSEDTMVVQCILGMRMGQREVESDTEDEKEEKEKVEGEEGDNQEKPKAATKKIDVEEFYVKYRSFSYLHCEWRTEEELMKGDKRINGKVKRYKQKKATIHNVMEFLEEEMYNPDYTEVDRILDMTYTTDPSTGKEIKHYLVKWKALAYEDSTWEMEDDVDTLKIQAYLAYKDPPPKSEWKPKKRPKPNEWKKLDGSPEYKNNNTLREYQLEGLNWLNFSYYNSRNCILADEMGLGKTIQSLTFVDTCHKYGIRGPYLIIAPLSTIPNWQREFEGWTDLNIIVYHGSQSSRNMILEYEMYYKDEKGQRIPNVYKFNVLITTFEVIISDCLDLKEIHWRCCIIDEAHRLKNRNCKLLEGLRLMYMDHRVLLSGTPLQNNVTELFSLLNFLEPTQFSSQESFLQEFGNLQTEDQVNKLQALLKPMMLRRMKEDVEKSLAPKEETIIEVELTNIQKKYYRAILERNFDFLVKGATYANVPSLMNTMMELRKCCLHPYLLNGAEDAIQQDYRDSNPSNNSETETYYNSLIQSSGKMVLVDKLLPKLRDNGHRVLIFSQMVKLLDILEDYLIYRKYPYERLDGRIRGNMRQAAIDRFCKPDSDRFVFLLCTKAGGLGINLTAADTVIIYDSDWNPQNDLQAQARCHRIGQSKSVKIYRLVCRNTYEREMFDKASKKLGLDKAVLQSMNNDQGKNGAAGGNSLGLSKADIEELLKKGAYGALMDEDGDGGEDFCEEDINQILSRRTTVIQHESEKGSSFSKASFSASNNRLDIEIDDPDFWKKWAKRAEIDTEVADKLHKKTLIVEEPRRRSQIRRYGHDESVLDCSDLESSASDSGQEKDLEPEMIPETNSRSRGRGRGRGRNRGRGGRGGRTTRASRWMVEEEALDPDNVKYGHWLRSECFKVEKGLLVYGWGRWKEILAHGDFRPAWKETDVQDCARMILLFCIRFYRGDDKIKGFIFDLIAPTCDGKTRIHHNHIGLSAPVPRGRKGKKKIREAKLVASHMEGADWAKDAKYDTEVYLDQGYSRHLTRHSNKVLLRVRLLFYIKQEIIGDHYMQIDEGCKATELSITPPTTELPPKPWWDFEADRSLLVGVFKHGYERYNVMRNDPALCFLGRCGPPDKAALMAEMNTTINEDDMDKDDKEDDKDDEDSNQTPLPSSPAVSTSTSKSDDDKCDEKDEKSGTDKKLQHFPTTSDINGRLRRLVTSYQRNNRKNDLRHEAKVRGYDHYLADKLMRRERMAEYIRERELRKTDYNQRRWSNREQAEFYRTISTFGVEYIRKEKRYDWSKFRTLSRLEKKYDETLTEYFRAFMAMCKRQCGIRLSEEENEKMLEIGVDRLPEERARRVLERVDLLNRLRNDIIPNPGLKEALELALPSKDMPDWWIPGKHDHDLLKGVGRHGLGRTDYYILYDPELNFRDIIRRHTAGEPLITESEKLALKKKYYEKDKSENVKEDKKEEQKGEEKEGKKGKGEEKEERKGKVDEEEEEEEEEVEQEEEEEDDTEPKEEEEEEEEEVEDSGDMILLNEDDDKGDEQIEDKPEEEMEVEEPITTKENEEDEEEEDREMEEEEEEKPKVEESCCIEDTKDTDKKIKVEVKEEVKEEIKEENIKTEEDSSKEIKIEEEEVADGQQGDEKLDNNDEDDNDVEEAETMNVEETDNCEEQERKSEDEKPPVGEGTIKEEEKEDDEEKKEIVDAHIKLEVKEEVKEEPKDTNEVDVKEEDIDTQVSIEDNGKDDTPEGKESNDATKDEEDRESLSGKKCIDESKDTSKERKEELKNSKSEKLEEKKESQSEKKEEGKCGSALLSLQQMDEAMAKCGNSLTYDNLVSSEPTVAQLLAQSAANPIKWPKDRMLQTRIEHLMYAVEHKKWPVGIDFQSSEQESKSSSLPQVTSSASSSHTSNTSDSLDSERRKRRQLEAAEVERQRLQAMLHPNLQHTLGLNKNSSNAAAAAAAAVALGLPPSFSSASLRSLMESTDERSKKAQQQLSADSHALRQLQALQGTLDLTIKPVNPGHNTMDMATASLLSRRGPGRPRLDDPMRSIEKRRLSESPIDSRTQEKKRRKLDEIVLGLTSKGKSPEMHSSSPKDTSPLSLLRGSSVTLLSSRDKSQVTNAVTTPKLSSSISITPTVSKRPLDTRVNESGASSKTITTSSDKDGKPGLVKQSDLPPGVTLPPGIELYRPADAKVDKWLEQHQGLLADSSRPSKDVKRRKIDFASMDWSQFSGDEHVSVINTTTGQRISGQEAPKLKYLAQWLMEHPNYDVDPQWADVIKERSSSAGFLSELQKKLVGAEKKHMSSRASIISSVSNFLHGSTSSSSTTTSPLSLASGSNTTTTSTSAAGGSTCAFLPSYHSSKGLPFDTKSFLQGLDPKNHLTAALAGLDPKLLGLDPKLLGSLDPKALGLDPKLLPPLDPKLLAAMGLDPKLLGLDTKHYESKRHEKESKASSSSSRGSDSKSLLHNIDPKLLGFDPKLFAGLDTKTLASLDPKLLANLTGLDPKALAGLDPKALAGLDPKLLASLDPKALAGFDPKAMAGLDSKLLSGLDPKLLTGIDPKLLAGLDPKLLGGLDPKLLGGLDPKLLGGLDPKLLGGLDPKLLGGLDPKLLGGLDPKLLGGLDPKLLAGLDPKMLCPDPKMLGLDPKMFGGMDPKLLASLDPKLLGGLDPKALCGLDSKLLATMGMDPNMMMMAGFGGLPGMAGLGMANPLLGGLAGFGIPGLTNLNDYPSTSKSKDHRNAAASSAASLSFPGMFPGASTAGLMYPPLGLGGLGSFQLPSMSSASSVLLNGLPASIMSMAGTSRHTSQASTIMSSSSKWKQENRRSREARDEHRRGLDRPDLSDEIERGLSARKEKIKEQAGLSKEERYLLKQMKAERLAREIEARGGHDPYAAHLDLSHWSQESHRSERTQDTPENLSRESEPAKHVQGVDAQNLSTKEVENGEKSGTNSEVEDEDEKS
ncbi:chromodomain-helicase-DNA-binding protein 7-like isoform X2 [Homarus americanus]|uniref:chromodomain-helicase-DNA-binding protein 7-like isoform X2 n=1 Tax=Homarus americanus TaxID=6706 RepID=UPI001C453C33|nr:chromodomain-helicase-DNA-binding protein 7-like isoform X2 [Homarus americanus]